MSHHALVHNMHKDSSNRTFCPMIPSLLVWQVTCQAQMAKNNSQTRTKGYERCTGTKHQPRDMMGHGSNVSHPINQCPVQHPTWLHKPAIFQNYGQVIQRRANIVFCLRQVLTVLFTLSLSFLASAIYTHECEK